MKGALKILAFISLLLVFSCEKLKIYDCNNCLDSIPYEVRLNIRLITLIGDDPSYLVRVYKGKIEDNILIDERTTRNEFHIFGFINQEYSAIATQVYNGIEYNIVSGTTIKVVSQDDYCEDVCYIVTDNEIDLRKRFN